MTSIKNFMLHSRKLHQINYAKYVRSRKSPAIFGYNNHNRDENAFSFPFLSFSLSHLFTFSLFPSHARTHTTHTQTLFRFHKRRRDIPPRRDRYGIIESSQFIYLLRVNMYVYIRLFIRSCILFACLVCLLHAIICI